MLNLPQITIAHTPDADDAFMFYALTEGIIAPHNFSIEHKLTSIQNLNDAASIGKYEMSAISFAAYPQISHLYYLMSCGACMGYKFGPSLLAKTKIQNIEEQIAKMTIAVPGMLTTAYLLLKIFSPNAKTITIPFNEIVQAVANGTVDAGLVIDGSQMTYSQLGLEKILDLGQWWYEETKLPLPLGGNIIRKDQSKSILEELTKLFRQSIQYSLNNREAAVKHAMRYAQGMSEEQAQKFIGRYVNEFTLAYGEKGEEALNQLYKKAYQCGIFTQPVQLEFAC